MTVRSSLPLPKGQGWIAGGAADMHVVYGSRSYAVTATYEEVRDPIRVSLAPDDIPSDVPSVWLAFTPEQWAAIFAAVASVAPIPMRAKVEEAKRGL